MHLIEDVFMVNNIDFISMNENFDTSTPLGRAMIGILSVFAQLERDQIKERMGMGKEARAKEGKWQGGSTVPVGYEYDIASGQLVINEYEAIQVREVFNMVLAGVPYKTIAETLTDKGYTYNSKTDMSVYGMPNVSSMFSPTSFISVTSAIKILGFKGHIHRL